MLRACSVFCAGISETAPERKKMGEHEWEAVKENARPLRQGYKMSALSSLLAR